MYDSPIPLLGIHPKKMKTLNEKICKLRELLMDREAWHAAVHGVAESLT